MIDLENVTTRANDGLFLLSATLRIRKGEHVVVCGPSGAGKTTLLRVIAGLALLSTGRVVIDGRLAADHTGNVLPPSERKVGMVFQDLGLWPHLSVAENVAIACRRGLWNGFFQTSDLVEDVLNKAHLRGFQRRRIHSLSGGELQRVAIARALAGSPRILLLDEPLTALDLTLRSELTALIADLIAGSGITVLSVVHDPHDAVRLAPDRVLVVEEGKVAEEMPCASILSIPARSATLRAWQARLGGA